MLTVFSKNEEQTLHATLPELKSATTSTSTPPARKRKGPKGPNPLSVKKKKPKEHPQSAHRSGAKELSSARVSVGSKRKLEQDVKVSVDNERSQDDDHERRKRRKESQLDPH